MENKHSIRKRSFFLVCSVSLLYGCASSPEKALHKSYSIDIMQMQFQPAELTIQKGDTVIWTNNDIVAHDVTEENDRHWTSGPLAPGESWSLIVKESVDYYCSIHVVMKGRLVVR